MSISAWVKRPAGELSSLERPSQEHSQTGVRRGKLLDAAALTIILAVVLIGLASAILQPGLVFVGHDVDQNYNWEMNTRAALAQGQFPFWAPYLLSGAPAFADFQTGVAYPPSVALRWLPINLFLTWNTVFHLWLAGAGTYLLCRLLGISRFAGTLAAVGYGLGGVLTARILGGHLHFLYAIAWVPVAFACAFRGARATGWLPYPSLAVVLAVQYLAGYVQMSVYTVLATSLLTLGCVHGRTPELPRRLTLAASRIVVTVALMVALSAGQLFSSLHLLHEMGRFSGLEYNEATRFSLEPQDLVTLFFPRAFADPHREFHENTGDLLWEKTGYVGLALPALALIAIGWNRSRPVALLGALAMAALLLSMGSRLPFYHLHHLLLSGFRYPGRLLVFWSLGIAVLGAMGLDILCTWARDSRRRIRAWLIAALIASGAMVAFISARDVGESIDYSHVLGSPSWLLVITVLSFVAMPIIGGRTRWHFAPAMLLGLALLCDLTAFMRPFVVVGELPHQDAIAAELDSDNVGRVISACLDEFSPYHSMNVLEPMVDGKNTAFLEEYARYALLTRGDRIPSTIRQYPMIWADTPQRMDLLDIMNVTHVVDCSPLNIRRFQLLDRVNGAYVYRNPHAMPRAWWACKLDLVQSEEQAIDLLADRQRDARSSPVIMNPQSVEIGALQRCEPSSVVHIVQQDTPGGSLVVDVAAPGDGVLVMSEVRYPDRAVSVDGVRISSLVANLAFMAVPVPAGTHRIELSYVPDVVYLGATTSAIGLALLLLLWGYWRRESLNGNP